ncbi:MAG: terminase family protein, partial [Planctomycetota bacterium]
IGWCAAPTYELCDKIFRELVILAAEHLRHRIITLKESERRLVLRNMSGGISEIRGKSADNPVSLLGEGLDWLIVDEASRLKPQIWEGHLSQRLIDKKGWALLISTPKGKGWFYELFRRGQGKDRDFQSWNSPSWHNPHLDREMIEKERDRLPDTVFKQEYAGEFLEGAGAVFRKVREWATGSWKDPEPDGYYKAGLDLAKTEDYTVLVIMDRDRQVVYTDRFNRLDWSVQVSRVQAATERYNNARITVDSSGLGDPIYESLRREGCACSPYPFTQKSKAALIDNLVLMIERGEIILPCPELWNVGIEELESFEYSVSEAGNIKSGAPHGLHDDCVIALALAAWELRHKREMRAYWV